jgi:cytochrome c biogenesis protein CcdA
MAAFLVAVVWAFWLGILTSISPCPLATNIAAVSFISRRVSRTGIVLLTGLLYTLGRMLAYVVIGVALVGSLLSATEVSYFLQKYMNKLLGPVLILVGMILLELISFNLPGFGVSEKGQKRIESWGLWGAGLLGILFALSFCPISAALFFGSLIPLSLKYESSVGLPAVYGLGSGLPVFLFAFVMAFASQSAGRAFNKLTVLERWTRRITGVIFIFVGIYYCLVYIFNVVG